MIDLLNADEAYEKSNTNFQVLAKKEADHHLNEISNGIKLSIYDGRFVYEWRIPRFIRSLSLDLIIKALSEKNYNYRGMSKDEVSEDGKIHNVQYLKIDWIRIKKAEVENEGNRI